MKARPGYAARARRTRMVIAVAAFAAVAAIAAEIDAEIVRDLEFFRMFEVLEAQEQGDVDETLIRELASGNVGEDAQEVKQ